MNETETMAFSKIFKTYYSDLYYYGLSFLNNETLVKDTLQDLFLKLWENKNQLQGVRHIKVYLMVALRRELIRVQQKQRKRQQYELESRHFQERFESSIDVFFIKKEQELEQTTHLKKAMQELSKAQKEIIYLRFYNGFSDMEIAQILEIRYQSVRNKLHRALKVLRKKMQ